MPFSILLLTLFSSPLHWGQTASLLKKSNLFRHARVWQRMSQRLDKIFPINISAETFLQTQQRDGKHKVHLSATQARTVPKGELEREETLAFTQRNPPLLPFQEGGHPPPEERGLASPLKHLPRAHPQFPNRNTQECKMSSGGSGLAFVSPPIHYFTSPPYLKSITFISNGTNCMRKLRGWQEHLGHILYMPL